MPIDNPESFIFNDNEKVIYKVDPRYRVHQLPLISYEDAGMVGSTTKRERLAFANGAFLGCEVIENAQARTFGWGNAYLAEQLSLIEDKVLNSKLTLNKILPTDSVSKFKDGQGCALASQIEDVALDILSFAITKKLIQSVIDQRVIENGMVKKH
jgi:hypothetical protein